MNEEMFICNCYSSCGCQNVVEDEGEDCDNCFGNCTPPPLNADTEGINYEPKHLSNL